MVESGSRLDLGSPLVSGTLRAVEDHACKGLEFKKDASCIDNWAAFSFDEPQ